MQPQAQQPPVQKFSGGGTPVGTAAINEQIGDYFRRLFGPGWDRLSEETKRGLAGRRRTEEEVNYSNEGKNNPLPSTQPTTPTDPAIRVGTEVGRATMQQRRISTS